MMKSIYQCLLLSLLCAVCAAGPAGARSGPVHFSGSACLDLGNALLRKVTDALETDQLFRGLNCTEQSAETCTRTETLSACTPMNSICLGAPEFTLEQDECLKSTQEDLRYYLATFKSYHDPDQILEQTVVRTIENFIQGCFSAPLLDGAQVQVSVDNENSFERRLKLCKVLKGFQIRTITINRVFNHLVNSPHV